MSTEHSDTLDPRLVESEERYRAVIENASDMIQSVRPDGTFEFVNNSWHAILGYDRDDLPRMTVWDIVHPDELEHCQQLFARAIHGEELGEVQTTFITKDRRPVPVEGTVAVRFLGDQPIATHGFFRDISERLRAEELRARNEQLERERFARFLEKMAALGKLAAGLAHELNNPASAARRASAELLERLEYRDIAIRELTTHNLTAAAWDALAGIAARDTAPPDLNDPILLSERETEMEEWLEARGIAGGWRLASDLVAGGICGDDLAELAALFPPSALGSGVRCLAESRAVRNAADVICRSATRMSDLVTAVKAYSYMDRAVEQIVDVHAGLDNTRIILAHQLKNMQVVAEYDRSLPPVRTFGSGLNQVWTNLIDNAADATGGKGRLLIRTRRAGDRAVVEITDDGPGIPPEIQSRIFEPFFTTKPQGSGTGLGLDTVWRIVTEEHSGTIEVESQPGRTTFRVSLPLADGASGEREAEGESER